MKLFARLVLLLALPSALARAAAPAIAGDWTGSALAHNQQVPIHLRIQGTPGNLTAALINGPEAAAGASTTFSDNHLRVTYPHFARTLDLTLTLAGKFTGSFGTATVRYPIELARNEEAADSSSPPAELGGDWEIAVKSAKGESAWQLRIAQDGHDLRAVIQRIDGDTGYLYGSWSQSAPAGSASPKVYRIAHFTPAGPALYTLTPQPDGTLLVSNLLRADAKTDTQQNLVARRPAAARAANLPAPTDPTQQTTMKDPEARFQFNAPDLAGHLVSNTDPRFDGKVVIVTVGGSWCPNCHDEAPMLESLYRQFHPRGLEVVNLSFEEDESQLKNPERLRAFIARYHVDYTVLLAGTTDQLNEKIPQADHLNCWPTSFILGRDGRVRQIHAGFAGPANPPAHDALIQEITTLVNTLLSEPVPTQSARALP